MMTSTGQRLSGRMVYAKLGGLVNQFYKILPIRESGEPSLGKYIKSLQREMIGFGELIRALDNDPQYLTLLAMLQYMGDHDCDVATVRSDVFKAIGILKRMQKRFDPGDGGE